MKRLTILLIFLSIISPLFSQGRMEEQVQNEVRIVSVAPNMSEIVSTLGLEENLVGRSSYCSFPEVECVGTIIEPDVEKIIMLRPTLVLISNLTAPSVLKKLTDAGINAHQIIPEESLSGTFELIRTIGRLTDRDSEAEKVIEKMEEKLSFVKEKVSNIAEEERRSCVYIVSYETASLWAATGDTYIDDLIEASGGRNIASAGSFWSISNELLLKEDPEVIFISRNGEMFKSTFPYSNLSGAVITVDADTVERQGVKSADVVELFASKLYPELF